MLSKSEISQLVDTPLRELGIGEQERNLYVLSLSIGAAPISKLAVLLGLTRPNTYKVIAKLEEHGLATFSGRRYRKAFVVASPEVVRQKLRERQESMSALDQRMTRALPDLLALYQQGELPTSIRIFGIDDAWLRAFSDIAASTTGDFLYFGNIERFHTAMGEQERWKRERIARGIRARVLMTPCELADELRSDDEKELRTTRTIAMSAPFVTSFQILGKKTIIRQPEAMMAILIDDEFVTEMFRSVFETLWKISA